MTTFSASVFWKEDSSVMSPLDTYGKNVTNVMFRALTLKRVEPLLALAFLRKSFCLNFIRRYCILYTITTKRLPQKSVSQNSRMCARSENGQFATVCLSAKNWRTLGFRTLQNIYWFSQIVPFSYILPQKKLHTYFPKNSLFDWFRLVMLLKPSMYCIFWPCALFIAKRRDITYQNAILFGKIQRKWQCQCDLWNIETTIEQA